MSSVIFNLGSPLRVTNPRTNATTEAAKSFVAGISDYYVTTESQGVSAGIEVGFTPLGAYVFLGVPNHEFADHLYSLSDVVGPDADLLTEQLAAVPDWQTRFDLIDDYIAASLRRGVTAFAPGGGRLRGADALRRPLQHRISETGDWVE